MYAIIKTGGKQYKVEEGQMIKIEKLPVDEEDNVEFDKVMAVSEDEEIDFGHPYLEDASVTGKVIEQGKNKKITIYKFKSKKRYRKKMGHRQPYTKVLIESIKA